MLVCGCSGKCLCLGVFAATTFDLRLGKFALVCEDSLPWPWHVIMVGFDGLHHGEELFLLLVPHLSGEGC